MCGRNIVDHQRYQCQRLSIPPKRLPPGAIVHIRQVDLHLFTKGEEVGVLILHIQICAVCQLEHGEIRGPHPLISVNCCDGVLY